MKQGAWKRYDPTTKNIIEDVIYKNDTAHGVYKSYYSDGKKAEEGTFDMGYQIGVWKQYYNTANNYLASVGEFKNGEKEGKWTYYFDAEGLQVYETGFYVKGQRNGQWKMYFQGAEKARQAEGNYKKGG